MLFYEVCVYIPLCQTKKLFHVLSCYVYKHMASFMKYVYDLLSLRKGIQGIYYLGMYMTYSLEFMYELASFLS